MSPTSSSRAVGSLMIVLAAVGLADAVRGGHWDLAVLLGALAVLAALALASTVGRRPLVPIRRDLVRWMARRAAEGDERLGDVADRAVGAYRSALTGEEDQSRGTHPDRT